MSYVIVDVEADGPIPAEYSMVCFGAVIFDERLDQTFYGQTRPVSDRFVPEALAVSGITREQHLAFDEPKAVMPHFARWIAEHTSGCPFSCPTTWFLTGSLSITISIASWAGTRSVFPAAASAIYIPAS
jgi:hypothetical protein